jgi:carbon-monoxide dehydrogenase large subunit
MTDTRGSILGHRVVRREDPAMLTVGGRYVDDLAPEGAAFVTFVRSSVAHARFTVDVSDACGAPGVLAVVTQADIDGSDHPLRDLRPDPPVNPDMRRPYLARGVVRFVGEPIAAILSDTRAAGEDAAELVVVDYDARPALIDPEEALADDAPRLFDLDDNVALDIESRNKRAEFDDCEVVVSQRIINQRVAPSPIEPRVSFAEWTIDGRLVQHIACQGAHPIRDRLARVYNVEPDQVRVVCPDVGGGFGAKADPYPEGLLLGWLARHIGGPVRWMDSRTDNMVAMGHGRGQIQDVTIGGTRDGKITAYKLEVIQDAGAYPSMGAVLPWMTRTMVTGVYDIANVEFSARSVVTTTTPTVAYRGAGRPEAAAAIERAVDLFAAEIAMDPAEVRRRNLVPATAFPYTTAMKTVYDSGDYDGALDRVLDAAGYDELRADQRRRRDDGDLRQLGIGISTYVEITALGGGGEYGSVEVRADGTVLVTTGSNPYGQGHHTSWAMLVSDRLGVPMDRIEVVHGDTDIVPTGSITGGSRSVQIAGSAIYDAAAKVIEVARRRAADLLEAAFEDIVFEDVPVAIGEPDTERRFHVAGTPAISLGWHELGRGEGMQAWRASRRASSPRATDAEGGATTERPLTVEPLVGLSDFAATQPTFPFGAHVAVVEVDIETGGVELTRLIAVDDAGRILNPLLAEGQVHGGLAQGAAQALLEEVRFDEDGNPQTSNFADYGVISATELPAFERVFMETPTPVNELGAKGIGESGTIGATPAVHNAVVDALSHLGVRHIDMPTTAERVWRAIESSR